MTSKKPMTQISFRVPDEDLEELSRIADEMSRDSVEVDRSSLIRRAISDFIRRKQRSSR